MIQLNKREQTLFLVTTVLVILYLFYQFLYSPTTNATSRMSHDLVKARTDLVIADSKLKVLKHLEKTDIKFYPKEEQLSKVFAHTLGVFAKLDMELGSISSDSSDNVLEIKIKCSGDFDSFYKYLKSLEDVDLPLSIRSVFLEPTREQLNIDLVLTSYL